MPTHNLEDKHTPGPWRFIEREIMEDKSIYPRHILGGENSLRVCLLESPLLATMITEGKFSATNDIGFENARRIVACVNACAGQSLLGTQGFSTEELESIAKIGGLYSVLEAVRRERDLAEQQRDELLAALKESNKIIQEYIDDLGTCDHSVGVCNCGVVRQQELNADLIAKAEQA